MKALRLSKRIILLLLLLVGFGFWLFHSQKREQEPPGQTVAESLPIQSNVQPPTPAPTVPPVAVKAPVSTSEIYREKISDHHWKEVSIYYENGLPYPLRKEQILHHSTDGETTVKSTTTYVANHILLGLSGDEVPNSIKALGDLKPIKSIAGPPGYVLILKDWSLNTVAGLLDRFAEEPFSSYLRYAEPDHLIQAHVSPNDPEFASGNQWGLHNDAFGIDIRAHGGWDIRTDADEIVVAIIDTGIDTDHPDLQANLWTNPNEQPDNGIDDDENGIVDDVLGYNSITETGDIEDESGHGTHVAGIAGAVGNNEIGIAGVAWRTNLMAVKFLNESGRGLYSDAIEAVYYSVDQGADLINASWGESHYSQGLFDAFSYASDAGILVVASAGNAARDNDSFPFYPASYDLENIISVGSIDQDGDFSHFSNAGKRTVEMAAPGENILSTLPHENTAYYPASGTSMAAPQVTGALALTLQEFPGNSVAMQKRRLLQSSRALESLDGKFLYPGIPDLGRSLSIVEPMLDFYFSSVMPNRYVRFRDQSLTLSIEVQGPEGVTYQWFHKGLPVPGITTSSVKLENLAKADSGAYKVVAEKGGFTISDYCELMVLQPSPVLKAAADTILEVASPDGHVWSSTIASVAVGSSSLVSASIGHNTSSSLYSHVEGEGFLSFFWRVSSEPRHDYLNFKVDGEVVKSISGEQDWQKVDIQLLGGGLKILEWEYIKDANANENEDRGFVDGIQWIPAGLNIPIITEAPQSQIISVGATARFEVVVLGTDLQYQWFKDGKELVGATNAVFEIPAVSENDQGFYRVEVYNDIGSARSVPVELKVGDFAVEILVQPTDILAREGVDVRFEVSASGTEPLVYQWFKDGEVIPGEIASHLDIVSVETSDEGNYQVTVSNPFVAQPILGRSATIAVETGFSGPRIVKQTGNILVPKGRAARLDLTVEGTFPLNYQWYFKNDPLPGENSSSLIIPSVLDENVGTYDCLVWNEFGSVRSPGVEIAIIGNIGDAIEQPLVDWKYNHEDQLILRGDITHDGINALEISAGPERGPTFFEAQLEGPLELSFWVFPRSGGIFSGGQFFVIVDGKVEAEFGVGASEFEKVLILVPDHGLHNIRFVVTSFLGDAAFYVDEVEIKQTPLLRVETSSIHGPAGSDLLLPLEILSAEPFTIEWYKNGEKLDATNGHRLVINKPTDLGEYYAVVRNVFGSSQSEVISATVFTEPVSTTLDVEHLNFQYAGEAFWYPQSESTFKGKTALRAPEIINKSSSIAVTVRGPVSGEFFGKELEFHIDGNPFFSNEVVNGWSRWKFDLVEEKDYQLKWTNLINLDGYLDGLKFFPLFYFQENLPGTVALYPGGYYHPMVSVSGNEPTTFQWYYNQQPLPGETGRSLLITYDAIETNDLFYVVATRGDISIQSDQLWMIKQTINIGGGPTFDQDGFTFTTGGNGKWTPTELEAEASGGVSIHPGSIPSGYSNSGWNSSIDFLVPSPGVLTFRVKNTTPRGSLGFYQSSVDQEASQTIYNTDGWETVNIFIRSDRPQTASFDYYAREPYETGEVKLFIDDLTFRSTPVLETEIADQYVSIGSPLSLQLEPITTGSPVTIHVHKDGQFFADRTIEQELVFEEITEEVGGHYQILLGVAGEIVTVEEFSIFPAPPLKQALNSDSENWRISNTADWSIVGIEGEIGNEGLLTSFERFPPEDNLNFHASQVIWIETDVSGPGILEIHFRLAEDTEKRAFLNILENGQSIMLFPFQPVTDWSWVGYTFEEDIERTIRFRHRHQETRGTEAVPLILDKFQFIPEFFVHNSPQSKIVSLGSSVGYAVTVNSAKTNPVTFSWYKDGDLIKSGPEGGFSIPGVGNTDFGNYLLRVEAAIGETKEYPFQILNSSMINQGLNLPEFEFTGTFDEPLEFSLESEPGHESHLAIRLPDGGGESKGSLRTTIQGPFTLRVESKSRLNELVSSPFVIDFDGGNEAYSLESEDWTTFEHVVNDTEFHVIEFKFSFYPTEYPSFAFLDNLVIDKTPFIVFQSPDEQIVSGSPLFFTADVSGGSNTALQWYKDGEQIDGQTNPYLMVKTSAYSGSGQYHLQAENTFGFASSDQIHLVVQDDFGVVFPYQGWNWTVDHRTYLRLDEGVGLRNDAAVFFRPPSDIAVRPGLRFNFLAPRTIEILATLPGATGNRFSIESDGQVAYTNAANTAGWVSTEFQSGYLGIREATVRFNLGSKSFIDPTLDDSPGWINRIKLSWPKDHPFTKWLQWSLPYNYETITDFELLFGDEDGDGIQNINEYATLSSAVSKSSNVWVSLDEQGKQENITFYMPQVPDDPFTYSLEVSSNLVDWKRVPSQLEHIREESENARILVRLSPSSEVNLPQGNCFLRLVVSSRIHIPKHQQF